MSPRPVINSPSSSTGNGPSSRPLTTCPGASPRNALSWGSAAAAPPASTLHFELEGHCRGDISAPAHGPVRLPTIWNPVENCRIRLFPSVRNPREICTNSGRSSFPCAICCSRESDAPLSSVPRVYSRALVRGASICRRRKKIKGRGPFSEKNRAASATSRGRWTFSSSGDFVSLDSFTCFVGFRAPQTKFSRPSYLKH